MSHRRVSQGEVGNGYKEEDLNSDSSLCNLLSLFTRGGREVVRSQRRLANTPDFWSRVISQPVVQTQLSFLMPFVGDRLYLRESPPFV